MSDATMRPKKGDLYVVATADGLTVRVLVPRDKSTTEQIAAVREIQRRVVGLLSASPSPEETR